MGSPHHFISMTLVLREFLNPLHHEIISPAQLQPSVCFIGTPPTKLKVKVPQPCPILCDPMDYTVREILQARRLRWVTVPSPGDLPNPGNLPNPGIKPRTPALQVDSLPVELPGKPSHQVISQNLKWEVGQKPLSALVCSLSTRCSSSLPSSPFSFQHSLQAPGG